jgi:transposase
VTALLKALHEQQDNLPVHARSALHALAAQLRALSSEVDRLEAQILACHRTDETSRRLATVPGVGPITASAI